MSSRSSERRRWELTAAERALVEQARRGPLSVGQLVRACARSPSLAGSVLRSAVRGLAEGVRNDLTLAWVLDSRRIRRLIPDAPSGIGWHGEEAFLGALLPHVHGRARVLEIGCGAGRIARQVAPRAGEVTCSDVSRIMLDEARENLAGERNVIFHRADGFHLAGFPDASFDLVYAHDVFVTFDLNQALALLDEAHRTLRAGGHLVVSFYTIDRPPWAATQLELVRRAARSGRFSAGHPRAYTAAQVDAMCEAVRLRVVDRRYGEGKTEGDRGHYVVVAEPVSRRPLPGVRRDRRRELERDV